MRPGLLTALARVGAAVGGAPALTFAGVETVPPVTAFLEPPQGPLAGAGVPAINDAIDRYQLGRLTQRVAMSIPAVRRAMHQLMTIATFSLSAWTTEGERITPLPPALAWLRQPDPSRPLFNTLSRTIRDGVWLDRSVWRVLDPQTVSGRFPSRFEHVASSRLTWKPNPAGGWIVGSLDGEPVRDQRSLIVFDWAGLGGVEALGAPLLCLYMDLQQAAARYARAPLPSVVLENSGLDLTNTEIQELLALWEYSRTTRSTAYVNEAMKVTPIGWNASELQLTEAREHAALEAARLFGLPARSVDASGGDSMTYANVSQSRLDLVEAMRPWFAPIEQTLSLTDRVIDGTLAGRYVPRNTEIRFNSDAFTREDPVQRAQVWSAWKTAGIVTDNAEIRANEPLLSSIPPATTPPAATTPEVPA